MQSFSLNDLDLNAFPVVSEAHELESRKLGSGEDLDHPVVPWSRTLFAAVVGMRSLAVPRQPSTGRAERVRRTHCECFTLMRDSPARSCSHVGSINSYRRAAACLTICNLARFSGLMML